MTSHAKLTHFPSCCGYDILHGFDYCLNKYWYGTPMTRTRILASIKQDLVTTLGNTRPNLMVIITQQQAEVLDSTLRALRFLPKKAVSNPNTDNLLMIYFLDRGQDEKVPNPFPAPDYHPDVLKEKDRLAAQQKKEEETKEVSLFPPKKRIKTPATETSRMVTTFRGQRVLR